MANSGAEYFPQPFGSGNSFPAENGQFGGTCHRSVFNLKFCQRTDLLVSVMEVLLDTIVKIETFASSKGFN